MTCGCIDTCVKPSTKVLDGKLLIHGYFEGAARVSKCLMKDRLPDMAGMACEALWYIPCAFPS